jgi:hypothetical protein
MRVRSGTARFGRSFRHITALLFAALLVASCSASLNPASLRATAIQIPGGAGGVGFDDMIYDSNLGKVIIPAGGTGNLDLIDPDTLKVTAIPGFSVDTEATGHSAGSTSVASAHGLLFALDRTTLSLNVVDPLAGQIIAATTVISDPDYIRYVAPTNELWVTERGSNQIEIFSLPDAKIPVPTSAITISVAKGPEALVIDNASGRAYTNQPRLGTTAVIDLKTRQIVREWSNGCTRAAGMVLDEKRGILFVGCKDGKVMPLDTRDDGRQINTTWNYGGGIDFISYNPHLSHVYLPSGNSAVMAVFSFEITQVTAPDSITPTLTLTPTLLGTADTTLASVCVTTDDHDDAWVCDPLHGQIFRIKDTFPATGQ